MHNRENKQKKIQQCCKFLATPLLSVVKVCRH